MQATHLDHKTQIVNIGYNIIKQKQPTSTSDIHHDNYPYQADNSDIRVDGLRLSDYCDSFGLFVNKKIVDCLTI